MERLACINHSVPKAAACNFPMNVSSTDFSSSPMVTGGEVKRGASAVRRHASHTFCSASAHSCSFSRIFSRLRLFVFFLCLVLLKPVHVYPKCCLFLLARHRHRLLLFFHLFLPSAPPPPPLLLLFLFFFLLHLSLLRFLFCIFVLVDHEMVNSSTTTSLALPD